MSQLQHWRELVLDHNRTSKDGSNFLPARRYARPAGDHRAGGHRLSSEQSVAAGWFLGVEIFFVISDFLMAALYFTSNRFCVAQSDYFVPATHKLPLLAT